MPEGLFAHISPAVITLSNGHSFRFMAASGALAFDGRGWPWEWPLRWAGILDPSLFTIVLKTLTRHPRKGNLRWAHPWSVIKKLPDGVVNAIGLTNDGIEWWLEVVAPTVPRHYQVVVSIEAENEKETTEMIGMLRGKNIVAVELNLSCPNTDAAALRTTEKVLKVCRAADRASSFPLIAKLSCAHNYLDVAKGLEQFRKIEAIAINSVPWGLAFPEKKSTLARYGGGGVSGKPAQAFTWKMIREISQAVRTPVIGPSVWEYEDIGKIFELGARAVSFGSIFVSHPWKPTSFVRRWKREMVDR